MASIDTVNFMQMVLQNLQRSYTNLSQNIDVTSERLNSVEQVLLNLVLHMERLETMVTEMTATLARLESRLS